MSSQVPDDAVGGDNRRSNDRPWSDVANVHEVSNDEFYRRLDEIMSPYPPPPDEVSPFPGFPQISNTDASQTNLPYTTPGSSIDPNLRSAQPLTTDAAHAAIQQLQDAAALHDADITTQAATQAAAAAAAAQAARQAEKTKRVAQACDACSQRKVKCDEGSPCKNCADLEVECTRNRQRRRRGPPNRVKERMEGDKRARTINDLDISTAAALTANTQPFDPSSQTSTDMIASPEIVQRLLSEFFTYVYPIFQFPHEPWLLQAFNRRADIGSGPFNPLLALISSMMALLAAMRPRQTMQLVASFGYHNIENFILHARSICINARGTGYLERDDLDSTDAASSFFLALLSVRGEKYLQYKTYLNEAVEVSHGNELVLNHAATHDEVQMQISRRIYWSVYAVSHSMRDWMNAPSRPAYDVAAIPRPAVLDDEHILTGQPATDHIISGPATKFGPLTLALDTMIQAYQMVDELLPAGMKQSDTDVLESVKKVRESVTDWNPLMKQLVATPYAERVDDNDNRSIRYEVQRINLILSHLMLRVHLLERTSKPSPRSRKVLEEYTSIAQGLLFLFKDIHYGAIDYDGTVCVERIQRIINAVVGNSLSEIEGPTYEALKRFEELVSNLVQAGDDEMRFHASNELRLYQEGFGRMVLEGKVKAVFGGKEGEL